MDNMEEVLSPHRKWLDNLPEGKRAKLKTESLRDMVLDGHDFTRVDLKGTKFNGSSLNSAIFLAAELAGCGIL